MVFKTGMERVLLLVILVLASAIALGANVEVNVNVNGNTFAKGGLLFFQGSTYINKIAVLSIHMDARLITPDNETIEIPFADSYEGYHQGNYTLKKSGNYLLIISSTINGQPYTKQIPIKVLKKDINLEIKASLKNSTIRGRISFNSSQTSIQGADRLLSFDILAYDFEKNYLLPLCTKHCSETCDFKCNASELSLKSYEIIVKTNLDGEAYVSRSLLNIPQTSMRCILALPKKGYARKTLAFNITGFNNMSYKVEIISNSSYDSFTTNKSSIKYIFKDPNIYTVNAYALQGNLTAVCKATINISQGNIPVVEPYKNDFLYNPLTGEIWARLRFKANLSKGFIVKNLDQSKIISNPLIIYGKKSKVIGFNRSQGIFVNDIKLNSFDILFKVRSDFSYNSKEFPKALADSEAIKKDYNNIKLIKLSAQQYADYLIELNESALALSKGFELYNYGPHSIIISKPQQLFIGTRKQARVLPDEILLNNTKYFFYDISKYSGKRVCIKEKLYFATEKNLTQGLMKFNGCRVATNQSYIVRVLTVQNRSKGNGLEKTPISINNESNKSINLSNGKIRLKLNKTNNNTGEKVLNKNISYTSLNKSKDEPLNNVRNLSGAKFSEIETASLNIEIIPNLINVSFNSSRLSVDSNKSFNLLLFDSGLKGVLNQTFKGSISLKISAGFYYAILSAEGFSYYYSFIAKSSLPDLLINNITRTINSDKLTVIHKIQAINYNKMDIVDLDINYSNNFKVFISDGNEKTELKDSNLNGLLDFIIKPDKLQYLIFELDTMNLNNASLEFKLYSKIYNITKNIRDKLSRNSTSAPKFLDDLDIYDLSFKDKTLYVSIRNNDMLEKSAKLFIKIISPNQSFELSKNITLARSKNTIYKFNLNVSQAYVEARLIDGSHMLVDKVPENNYRTYVFNEAWQINASERIIFNIKDSTHRERYDYSIRLRLNNSIALDSIKIIYYDFSGSFIKKDVSYKILEGLDSNYLLFPISLLKANNGFKIYLYFNYGKTPEDFLRIHNSKVQWDPKIILDNRQASKIGRWPEDYKVNGYYGVDYVQDLNTGKGEKYLIYELSDVENASYELYYKSPGSKAFATNSLIVIKSGTGTQELRINQQQPFDWKYLGLYDFNRNSKIIISNKGADGLVVGDAFKLVKVSDYINAYEIEPNKLLKTRLHKLKPLITQNKSYKSISFRIYTNINISKEVNLTLNIINQTTEIASNFRYLKMLRYELLSNNLSKKDFALSQVDSDFILNTSYRGNLSVNLKFVSSNFRTIKINKIVGKEFIKSIGDHIIRIKNSNKNTLKFNLKYSRKDLQKNTKTSAYSFGITSLKKPSQRYKVEFSLINSSIKSLRFDDLIVNDNLTINLEELNNSMARNFSLLATKGFAIDPTNLNFTSAQITVEARGNALYKCKDYNFTSRKCFGKFIKIKKLTPGFNYTVNITKADPAYLELMESVAQVYTTATQNGQSTLSISLEQETYVGSGYNHSTNSQIKVNETGLYKVSYGCVWIEPSNINRQIMENYIRKNGATDITPSKSNCYIRRNNADRNRCSNNGVVLVNLTAGDYIELRGGVYQSESSGEVDTYDDCWMYVELVTNEVAEIYDSDGGDDMMAPPLL